MQKKKRFFPLFLLFVAFILILSALFFYPSKVELSASSFCLTATEELASAAKTKGEALKKEQEQDAGRAERERLEKERLKKEQTLQKLLDACPVDFEDYKNIPDVFGWIVVPGTPINYPLVCSDVDNAYYLDHDIYGNQVQPGSIFMENYNSRDMTDSNTIFYGHNQRDRSQFGSLHSFEDKEFFDTHSEIHLYLADNRILTYQIFSCSQISDLHILAEPDMNHHPEVFEAYLQDILKGQQPKQFLRPNVSVTKDDKIITLATCENGGLGNRRYVVQAVLTEIYETK